MLKRVSIQNFKSLKDVTLDLQKVNLLIGPNNSGKTNFLKALEFFQHRLHNTPYTRDDFDRLQYKYDKTYEVKVRLTTSLQNGTFIHATIISNLNYKDSLFSYCQSEDINKSEIITENIYNLDDDTLRDVNRSSNKLFHFISINELLGNVIIYKLEPSSIIKLNDLNPDEYVYENASNLTSFILNLGQNNKQLLDDIQSQLSECVGDIVGIASPTVKIGNSAKLRLKLIDRMGNDFWADEVSEGVLYFLALLCIINQPNPPKLLLLEEPEKGIHPRRIWEVMKFIFQLAEEKDVQIILTTHNEHVVNAFSAMPESVFVFDKDEETGTTTVRNLQKDIIEPSNRRIDELGLDRVDFTDNLGENWLYGLIGGVPANML